MSISVVSSKTPMLPLLLPWVTGRFYTIQSQFAVSMTSTAAMTSTVNGFPMYIPSSLTISSVGVEVTGAGTAGALARFAMYKTLDLSPFPGTLLKDFGTTATDITGFVSVSPSYYIHAGWYWIFVAFSTPTTYPTCRVFSAGGASIRLTGMSSSSGDDANDADCTAYAMSSPGTAWTTYGFPNRILSVSADLANSATMKATGNIPRILIGV